MRSKEERRKEVYERATGKPYNQANKEKGILYEQVKKFSPHLLYNLTELEKAQIHIYKMEFTEVIISFQGQLGVGGSLPAYLTQDNCNILPDKSGILILRDMFLELMEETTILEDFEVYYFY